MSFLNCNYLIGVDIPNGINNAAGPSYLDEVDFFPITESKMESQVVLGDIARTASHFIDLDEFACSDFNPCTDTRPVAFCPYRSD